MTHQRLFEYVIIHHPRRVKVDEEAGNLKRSILLKDVTRVMAADEKEVGIIAAREIDPEYLDRLDTVEIGIRPF